VYVLPSSAIVAGRSVPDHAASSGIVQPGSQFRGGTGIERLEDAAASSDGGGQREPARARHRDASTATRQVEIAPIDDNDADAGRTAHIDGVRREGASVAGVRILAGTRLGLSGDGDEPQAVSARTETTTKATGMRFTRDLGRSSSVTPQLSNRHTH
jgi:hypothetical protein